MHTPTYTDTLSLDTSDSVLVKQIAAGDQEAFEILVSRYQTPLFNFIRRYIKDYELTHDILQHVFFSALSAHSKAERQSLYTSYERTRQVVVVPGSMEPLYGRTTQKTPASLLRIGTQR